MSKGKNGYRNPLLTVDIIVEVSSGIILIERKNPPHGYALPGGFVDYGELLEAAARREAREETSLRVDLLEQFYTYSDPRRDPRHHTVTAVYLARVSSGKPRARDDARALGIFREDNLPTEIAFDHRRILEDYFRYRKTGQRPSITKGQKP
ncbi:MAG: NUDIX hydrolase [Proteobacteria bacterium]|nr:NUDIX hydrolase [Pseudomonadota bacterium]